MLCAEQNAFWQEYQAAVKTFHASIRDLASLVTSSAAGSDFNLAHSRISDARRACDAVRAALEHHQTEHGCSNSN